MKNLNKIDIAQEKREAQIYKKQWDKSPETEEKFKLWDFVDFETNLETYTLYISKEEITKSGPISIRKPHQINFHGRNSYQGNDPQKFTSPGYAEPVQEKFWNRLERLPK